MSRRLGALAVAAVLPWTVTHLLALREATPAQLHTVPAALVALLAPVALLLFLREGRQLLREPMLLVPLALLHGATWLLAQVTGLLPFLRRDARTDMGAVPVVLSVQFVIGMVLSTIFDCWTVLALLRRAAGERAGDAVAAAWHTMPWRFWRGFGALAIGYGGLFALAIAPFALISAHAGALGLPLLLLLALIWNALTATLLVEALVDDGPWLPTCARAMAESWRWRRVWLWPTLLQLLALGTVTWLPSAWNVHALWTGGFADDSSWYGDWCKLENVEPLGLASFVLTTAFLLLATAIKLRIVVRLHE